MSDTLDDWVDRLQSEIDQQTRAQYGEAAFQRWQNPLYMGVMTDADGHGRVTGTCGDTMEMFLKFDQDRVAKASFTTDGCGASTVCGSFAAEMAQGCSAEELMMLTGEKVLSKIGDIPEEDHHCAFLAAATLQAALEDCLAARKGVRHR